MINNLSINVDFFKRKIIAPLLIVATLVTGGAYKGIQIKNGINTSKVGVSTIVDTNKDNIYLDEYYNQQKDINIKINDEVHSIDIYKSIELMEKICKLQLTMQPYVRAHDGKNIKDIAK